MRSALTGLGLGEIALQEFGSPNEVLIRIERQPGDAGAQQVAVTAVREALSANYSDTLSYRRVETVGPKVGGELIQAGIIAVVVSVFLMLVYIWFRFELPFAIGAVIALLHDVLLSLGIFAALGLEFNLPIVAAILLIVGYSMNDTVVVYDRVCARICANTRCCHFSICSTRVSTRPSRAPSSPRRRQCSPCSRCSSSAVPSFAISASR